MITCFELFFLSKPKMKNPYISLIHKGFALFAVCANCSQGWKMGLEPTTFGTTIRRSNRLSYIHRLTVTRSYRVANVIFFFGTCKKIGRKIFAGTPKMTKWQSGLYLCHPLSAKKRLAHQLLEQRMRMSNKLFNSIIN